MGIVALDLSLNWETTERVTMIRHEEVQKLTIDHDPLPVEPALRHVVAALQDDVITLQS